MRTDRDQVIHGVLPRDDYYFFARTLCDLHIAWKANITGDDEDVILVEPSEGPVDCMTCLVRKTLREW